MQPNLKRRIRFFFHRWHRRFGVASAVLVLILALTGIALNHTGGLKLEQIYPQSSFLLWPYHAVLTEQKAISTDHGFLLAEQGWLSVDERPVAACQRLNSYARNAEFILVACDSEWHLLTTHAELIESFDPSFLGISEGMQPAVAAGKFVVGVRSEKQSPEHSAGAWASFDPVSLTVEPGQIEHAEWQDFVLLPARNSSISLQRIVLDIHSGRWFGDWGVWMMDLAAIALILLALSGLWLWWSRGRNRW